MTLEKGPAPASRSVQVSRPEGDAITDIQTVGAG
jgi:hypothetical protein